MLSLLVVTVIVVLKVNFGCHCGFALTRRRAHAPGQLAQLKAAHAV